MPQFNILLALTFLFTAPVFASITDQEILLAPQARYPSLDSRATVSESELSQSIPQRFSVGLGSGVNSFGGNIGKLYKTSSPVLELRGDWVYHPMWVMKLGAELAKYSFNAVPNGAVQVSTKSVSIGYQAHFLSTALASQGFDPYVSMQGQWVNRSQNFQSFNLVESDSALGLGAGLGTNYLLAGGQIGLWAEAGANQIFFKDRFQSEYSPSGVEDTTGLMYSGRVGMKYWF